MTGLEPRDFTWVISGRLAVSERIGGYGFQHRRVRREEEITWLKRAGVNTVLSLLEANQNIAAYEEGGLRAHSVPLLEVDREAAEPVYRAIGQLLAEPRIVLLVHRDIIDDAVAGVLAGYLVYSGKVTDPIMATAVVQEILGRPLGPDARALIPQPSGA
ncbi:MAG TPA: hypothetical protein VMM81_03555 [Acidimicrobiia bacterium]|nr:hypothetical protein [Acidimicrobiia bacterium]